MIDIIDYLDIFSYWNLTIWTIMSIQLKLNCKRLKLEYVIMQLWTEKAFLHIHYRVQ